MLLNGCFSCCCRGTSLRASCLCWWWPTRATGTWWGRTTSSSQRHSVPSTRWDYYASTSLKKVATLYVDSLTSLFNGKKKMMIWNGCLFCWHLGRSQRMSQIRTGLLMFKLEGSWFDVPVCTITHGTGNSQGKGTQPLDGKHMPHSPPPHTAS